MTILRWQMHVGYAIESSGWGLNVATTPAAWVPVHKCDFEDDLKYYYDTAYRSVQANDFGAYPTTGTGKFDLSTDVYVDSLPLLAGVGMIGDNDVVTTVYATALNVAWTNVTVAQHTFILQPNGPKSVTFFDYNGFSERSYPGGRIEDVTLKYAPDGAFTSDYKGQSRLSVLQNSTTVPQIGGYAPILGWQAALTLNNTANVRLMDASIMLKRKSDILFTQAQTQSPTNIYVFPLEVDADLTVDFVDEAEYNLYRTGNQSATFDLFFVNSSNNAVRFTIPQPIYTSYKVDRSKDALTAKLKLKGIYQASQSTNIFMRVYNTQTLPY